MGTAKEWCNSPGVSCIVTVMTTSILLASGVFPSQGLTADYQHSETCYGTGDCSLHTLTCQQGSRLAVLEASYGFKLKQVANNCVSATGGDTCPDFCCRYNKSSDCRQRFTAENMQRVQNECSHTSSCRIRAQRGDNTHCSIEQRGITSTMSILSAVCIADAQTVNPCANSTVSGHTVSLHFSHPPLSSPCLCTLHRTNTTMTSDNDAGNIDFYVYEIKSSSADWAVKVESGNGTAMYEYSGAGTSFPAFAISSPQSSLPLSLNFSFDDLGDSPQRVWLGFQGEKSSLTLRCGQDAVDYAMSLTTTSTTTTTTTSATTTSDATTATASTNTTATTSTSTGQTASTKAQTTASRERTTVSSGGANSRPLTSEDPQKATTDIIVYAVVGVLALILCAFLYVCVRQLRKKGCPSWCPPPCRDLECGKRRPQDSHQQQHNLADTASHTSTHDKGDVSGKARVANGNVSSNGSLGNGHVVQLTGERNENGGVSSAFTQRRCSFEHLRRHRGSVQSLRRASFSDLEDIKETEEDEEEEGIGKLTTGHKDHLLCRNHPHHASNHLHPEVIKIVDEHLATIEADTSSDDKRSDDDDDDDDDDDNDSVSNNDTPSALQQDASSHISAERGNGAAEDHTGEDKQHDNTHVPPEDASVVFHLGDVNGSSDPDLEQYFTKL